MIGDQNNYLKRIRLLFIFSSSLDFIWIIIASFIFPEEAVGTLVGLLLVMFLLVNALSFLFIFYFSQRKNFFYAVIFMLLIYYSANVYLGLYPFMQAILWALILYYLKKGNKEG